MKLFTIGPVEMYPSTREVYKNNFVYFRTNEYSTIVNNSLKKLSCLLGNTLEDSLIYLTASGTAAMEAVVENCSTKKDKALVINGGTFGQRFCDLLKYHNIPFDSINIEWNEVLKKEQLLPYENKGYTALFVNIHETSSGQLYDISMLSDFCKRNNIFLIVDAISSFLADDFNMQKYGIDATIISSQKGLCLSPGLSFVSFSKRMLEKINNNQLSSSKYFDFKDYLNNISRGQTPYTPAVYIMYELQDMLNLIEKEGGYKKRLENVERKCNYFRIKAKELGFKVPNYPLSNMLTPIEFEDNINAYDVFLTLKNKYKIFVNPCGGNLANKLLRISHIGNTSIEDIDDLFEKLKLSIKELNGSVKYDRQ